MTRPVFAVIAGANGCGKSTLTRWAKTFFQQSAILDPDAVAVDLQEQSGEAKSDLDAGKQVLRAAEEHLVRSVSFSVETTLFGKTYLRMLARARELGYTTRLFYIGTESVEINKARVAARVLKGGHDVPVEDKIRRYPRSFRNLCLAISLSDECVLLDNSTSGGHRIVGLKLAGTEVLAFDPLTAWAGFLRR